jgi:hypothetical protein
VTLLQKVVSVNLQLGVSTFREEGEGVVMRVPGRENNRCDCVSMFWMMDWSENKFEI